jgi:M6 family metalloprotease-like protein
MGSVKDYFSHQSNGIFKPHFDIFGPYTSSYRSDQFTNANTQSIFRTILNKADADVNFRNYDGNHDNKVDMVAFIVAGYSAAMGNNANYLWPHESVLAAARKDNIDLDRYSCSTELYGYETMPSSVHIDGIGTICHEFSHVLGLPDLYDTDDSNSGGESHVPGYWDLMAAGNYNDEGRTPAGYSLFERYALGWANPQVINSEGKRTLNPLNEVHDGYILLTPTENEFFVIENRQQTSWDTYLPGHGMLITRVDSTNLDVWTQNDVNCNPNHNYVELIRAAGSTRDDKTSDPFPGTKNITAIGNESLPNLKSWAGLDNEYELFNIAENEGIITFDVAVAKPRYILKEDFEQMPATTNASASNVQGNFAKWTFSKANVTAPGNAKCIGEHSVMTKLGCRLYTTTPINENIAQASIKVFNASTTAIKFRLEYSTDGTTWIIAKTTNGLDLAEISTYTLGQAFWALDIKESDDTYFRITQLAGNKTTYIDDFALYPPAQQFAAGDVNGDGEINVADVNSIIDIIMSGSSDADIMARADVNGDGEVNVADVNAIIDMILNS